MTRTLDAPTGTGFSGFSGNQFDISPPSLSERIRETREDSERLALLIGRLPDRQREAIVLKFQAELSYKEIAEVTGLTTSNVGYLIHVGLRTLRDGMGISDPARAGISEPRP